MPKRRLSSDSGTEEPRRVRVAPKHAGNSLDSDEEDSADEIPDPDQEQHLDGQEEATIAMEGGVAITPFNMREELEEGHFDVDGHYHWKKENEIRDGWLDNIDWVQIKGRPEDKYKVHKDDDLKGLGDDSSSDSEAEDGPFNLIESYKEMLSYMKEKESVLNALRRLGSNKKISSAERWKRKKAGIVDTNDESVTKLTSVANEVLSRTGNMDVYQMTFEKLTSLVKSSSHGNSSKMDTSDLDMYADDFDSKEKNKKNTSDDNENGTVVEEDSKKVESDDETNLMWEFRWSQTDGDEVHGPHTSEQMQEWVREGYFKTGVWVRKCGQDGPFYTSNRIDFELYI